MEMKPKERVAAYARGEEVDRIPTALSVSETIPPLYGISYYDSYYSVEAMVAVQKKIREDFHADNMGIGIGLRGIPEALGTEIIYPDKNIPYIGKTIFSNLDEFCELDMINIEKDGRFPIIIDAIQKLQELFGDEYIIGSGTGGPATTAIGLIGTENFLKGTMRKKEKIHKLMQFCTDVIVDCCSKINKKTGVHFSISEPIAAKELLSQSQFDEFIVPYLAQLVKRMNQFQGSTGLHICGHTKERWKQIVGTGISDFWIDNCEQLKELKEEIGSQVSISGNVPPVDVLYKGNLELIEESVKDCILQGSDNPKGFTLGPGCTTPAGTSIENLKKYMDAARKYGSGAKKGELPRGVCKYI